jgi:hypothetical protein
LLFPQPSLINNRWISNESGKTFVTIDPATGAEICQVSEGGQRSNKDRGGRHRHQSEDVCSTVLPTLYTEVKTVTSKLQGDITRIASPIRARQKLGAMVRRERLEKQALNQEK